MRKTLAALLVFCLAVTLPAQKDDFKRERRGDEKRASTSTCLASSVSSCRAAKNERPSSSCSAGVVVPLAGWSALRDGGGEASLCISRRSGAAAAAAVGHTHV